MRSFPLLKQDYITFLFVFTKVARNFRKKAVKSTIFELQKSFKYKFACTINFLKNEKDNKYEVLIAGAKVQILSESSIFGGHFCGGSK